MKISYPYPKRDRTVVEEGSAEAAASGAESVSLSPAGAGVVLAAPGRGRRPLSLFRVGLGRTLEYDMIVIIKSFKLYTYLICQLCCKLTLAVSYVNLFGL